MKNKITKILFIIFSSLILSGILFVAGINIYMVNYAKPYIYTDISDLPESYTVILPGAKVYSNNISFVVRDRIDGGVNCLKAGKGQRVLISGDHGQKNYDEVNQMRLYMQKIYGINPEIIFMDHAGFSTYETMYRARDIFCVDSAVVVTQKFHTARSVYIGRKLGLNVVGYEAPELNPFSRRVHSSWNIRECLARVKAFFMVMMNSKPTYLGEQIPITGNSKASWDMEE
ncbi:MAG: YdcF family protein [Treponema sp.]|nr:YdcF family protein [Treponema sp.]